ncbi:MAG: TIGR02679 family protein [Azoarcus sp.]
MNGRQSDLRLQRLLGGSELATVRQRLRRRFERVEPGATLETIRLTGIDPDAHRALCQITGRRSRLANSMTLNIPELDARLREAGLANSLRDALERLEGPIVAHARLKKERQARWEALMCSAKGGPLLREWQRSPTALTLLKRLGREPEQAEQLLVTADAVLQRLPASGLTRAQLSAETLGDAHALDSGRPVATLVLAAWRHHERSAMMVVDDSLDSISNGERQRDTWARAGVLVNELARPVLFLNLPEPLESSCTWLVGEPAYLSLRQLLRQSPLWPVAGRKVFVCENPNIVAIAADRLGTQCAPLVCTDGMPAAAQRTLLDQLAAAGAHLFYHGDYDWPGIAIGNHVMRTWQATPWRFSTGDYLAAFLETPKRPADLDGGEVDAIWDQGLTSAMRRRGLAIAEEATAEVLLEDLARSCQ